MANAWVWAAAGRSATIHFCWNRWEPHSRTVVFLIARSVALEICERPSLLPVRMSGSRTEAIVAYAAWLPSYVTLAALLT